MKSKETVVKYVSDFYVGQHENNSRYPQCCYRCLPSLSQIEKEVLGLSLQWLLHHFHYRNFWEMDLTGCSFIGQWVMAAMIPSATPSHQTIS